MNAHHMILFYVQDPLKSAAFYRRILGVPPLDASPGFSMFKLNDGTMLGLWNKTGVEPKPLSNAGSSELAFHVKDNDEVESYHASWVRDEVNIAQAPTHMDFGYTFTGLDLDGNRLRVFAAA